MSALLLSLLMSTSIGGLVGAALPYLMPAKHFVRILHWTRHKRESLTPEELKHVEWIENNPSDAAKFNRWW